MRWISLVSNAAEGKMEEERNLSWWFSRATAVACYQWVFLHRGRARQWQELENGESHSCSRCPAVSGQGRWVRGCQRWYGPLRAPLPPLWWPPQASSPNVQKPSHRIPPLYPMRGTCGPTPSPCLLSSAIERSFRGFRSPPSSLCSSNWPSSSVQSHGGKLLYHHLDEGFRSKTSRLVCSSRWCRLAKGICVPSRFVCAAQLSAVAFMHRVSTTLDWRLVL